MENKLGVMQGRLLPKYLGRYQAHPVGYWQGEFQLARKLGLDCIEFILDYDDADQNPLLISGGINQIEEISKSSGVAVKTVCADFFMEAPLHSSDSAVRQRSQETLIRLLHNVAILGVSDIVIPCVDHASLRSEVDRRRFGDAVARIAPTAEALNINLSLETDLPPESFAKLLKYCDCDRVTVNYDIGNSASLGYNPREELDAYGDRISDIHIKDRRKNGGPVLLGTGAANFDVFFDKLSDHDYRGPFIMQAYRDDEGLQIFQEQLEWVKPYLVEFGTDNQENI